MTHAILFDCEFLTAEGAPSRFWCGPADPDPVVAQIGLVKLGLGGDYPILETRRIYVLPKDRHGARVPLDPAFTKLTGISEDVLTAEGVPLAAALATTEAFAGAAKLWSWGKDEFNLMAISCYVEGLAPPIPAHRFGNACALMLKAGMPEADLKTTRSHTLAAYFSIDRPALRGHDALDDARSIAYAVQFLLRDGRLTAADLL